MKQVVKDKKVLRINLNKFDFIYIGEVKKFGNSGHIPAMKKLIGRKVCVFVEGEKR